jgi:class 3 adenylate cyclase
VLTQQRSARAGDCYLAVTGLPDANPEHALAMSDFALTMEAGLARACEAEGVTAGTLSLRVGIHSGRVTAGVLRADRSRFQLFGDTVNTASRMESTGCAGRIQVSAATEQLLRNAGRHTVEYRGKVEAKGKGLVDTYWLLGHSASAPQEGDSAGADVPDAGALRRADAAERV